MRRSFLGIIVLLLVLGGISYVWLKPVRPKPDLSFIVMAVDSMRADHVGAYGYQRPTTPRIDALARHGIVFENAISQAPGTKPSVASIFTSTYVNVHRVLYSKEIINGQDRTDILSDKFLTLAEAMKAGGYATGGFGQKIHLRAEYGFGQGFDGYDMHAGRAEKVNRKVLGWLKGEDPDRFFMYLHYNDPHYPYTLRPGYSIFGSGKSRVRITGETKRAFRAGRLKLTADDIREQIDLYDGEIRCNDHYIGELLDSIKSMGYSNVLVIVIADHGDEFLDHGDITHGHTLYNELVHVPFIVGGSAMASRAEGERISTRIESIDIMPTILDMAGLPRPPLIQGRSLAPILNGATTDLAAKPVFSGRRAITDPGFSDAILDGRWKLYRDVAHGRSLLFDLEADPGEKTPVENPDPEVLSGLESKLEKWVGTNDALHDRILPKATVPLDPKTEEKLRSLGYVD